MKRWMGIVRAARRSARFKKTHFKKTRFKKTHFKKTRFKKTRFKKTCFRAAVFPAVDFMAPLRAKTPLRVRNPVRALLQAAFLLACAAAAPPWASARPLETTRISIQDVPYPGIRITVPSGQSVEAIPESSLDAAAGRAAEVVILYAVPSGAFGQSSFLSRLQRLRNSGARPRTILLASFPPRGSRLPPYAGVLRPGVPYAEIPFVRILVQPLPVPGSRRSSGLFVLGLDAPHARTGILFPGRAEGRFAPAQEHDVLVLRVSDLETGIDSRTLSALDPAIAVLFGGKSGPRRAVDPPPLDRLVDQLQELWTDVYRVEPRRPFVVVAGPHGLFLPIHGRRLAGRGAGETG